MGTSTGDILDLVFSSVFCGLSILFFIFFLIYHFVVFRVKIMHLKKFITMISNEKDDTKNMQDFGYNYDRSLQNTYDTKKGYELGMKTIIEK